MTKTIGIDLGTTFSAVAVMEAGKAVIIPNAEGARTTPSIVCIKDGERTVGQVAKNQTITDPLHTIRSIKRHMGEKNFTVNIEGKDYTPQEISAIILQKLKADAEAYLGSKVTDAVITVPAYFNDSQRQATKDAGKIAGLNVLRIINEPTAAAIAYGMDKSNDHTILVFDFGGGTFDVSVLELGDGVFEVKATSGDNYLGGDDIDDLIMQWLADEFKKSNKIDLLADPTSNQRLKDAAEKAKIELSSKQKVSINLPYITADAKGPKHLNVELTRSHYEGMIENILKKLEGPTKQALKDANLTKVDKVIFVGGSTRIPIVQTLVKKLTGLDGDKSVNPDEAVAIGAAIQAGVLAGEVKDVLLLDVTPLSLGIETLGGVFTKMIERNTTIPTKKSQIYSTAADNQTAVTIRVFQGERAMAAGNKILGQFDLLGIPPAPRGVPQIEVAFDIDANGIVNVHAKDLGTGKEQKIQITGSGNLSEAEIKKMEEEAKLHAAEDEKLKEKVEMENNADTIIRQGRQQLEEFGDKIDQKLKSKIDKELSELEDVRKKDNVELLKRKLAEVEKVLQEIGAQVYQQGQQPPEGKGKKSGKVDEEKVVDAEFVEDEK